MDANKLTDEQIDLIANDGMRNVAGGIYATRVYEFARAIESEVRAALSDAAQAPLTAEQRKAIMPTGAEVIELFQRAVKELPASLATEVWQLTPLQAAWVVGMLIQKHTSAPVAPQAAGDAAQAPVPTRYFVYDHEGGYNEFKTDSERETGHQAAIDAYLDTGCDGWSEEVTQVVSGIVTHKTVKTNEEHKPAPCAQHPEHDDENCDDCAAWNEWPNHDFETYCQYEPALIAAPVAPDAKAPTADQLYDAHER
ncbi:hypothetical protein [Paraburkholderia sacchari]|uniref:hypothetical protein n=1 Tax=Paraburkholderia sacchari TaxID=159450 RepID=UPI003D99192A